MAKYRDSLPQLKNRFFLSDGGIETTLIFNEGLDLPDFAAFHLMKDESGREALRKYFETYTEIARRHKTGLILESQTWRANADSNASRKSHEELNGAPEVYAGNPDELAAEYAEMRRSLTNLNVMGGCCGTDHRHIEKIAEVCAV